MEKEYGWRGILAEPAKTWHKDLVQNRDVDIDFSCVWKRTGDTLEFHMADAAELSTISDFKNRDEHSLARENSVSYKVDTLSLLDLLKKFNAPHQIDYLSIDTEGSEFEILNAFDFNEYEISIISCEHNYTDDRDKINNLLTSKGYERRFEGFSKWDDWYFKV